MTICPDCKQLMPSFTWKCPTCGHELDRGDAIDHDEREREREERKSADRKGTP